MGKKFYLSKTFWVNILGIAAIVAQSKFGYVIPPETQVIILSVINAFLRLLTREPVTW